MKRFLITILGSSFLFACGEELSSVDSSSALTFDEYVASITKTFEGEDIYVIDGDIAIEADQLEAAYGDYVEAAEREALGLARSISAATVNVVGNSDDIWNASTAQNLSYCVSTEFGSQQNRMINEMAQAAADLEAVADINFNYVSSANSNCTGSNSSVLFAVRPWTSGGACAFFPSGGGCVQRTIVIDINDLDTNPGYGATTTLGVLRHEIGHALGLRHEHVRTSGQCSESGPYRFLTEYDRNSMMHYPWCPGATNNGDLEVTNLDADGLAQLYGNPSGGGGNPDPDPDPDPPSDSCSYTEDFDLSGGGWTTEGNCSTGSFIRGVPNQVTDSGVTTQVGGDRTGGSAAFTATNTAAGTDDVDGGECVLVSPAIPVSTASELSAWYFHGQRDAGDDPSGDYFVLEVSTNSGASYTPIVSIGDVTSNASWTEANANIPAGASVVIRVRVSDGSSAGDLVEAGLDDVSICN